MHLGNFPWPQEVSELDFELPTRGLLESEEPYASVAVDQGNRRSQSLDDLISPNSITGNNFTDYEELDLMTVAALKAVLPCRGAESSKRHPVSQRETNCLFDLRTLSPHCVLWRDSGDIGFVQHETWERRHSGLWITLGASTIVDKWSSIGQTPKLRKLWHYTIETFWEEEDKEINTDWESVRNCILSKLKRVRISGFRANS